MGPDAIAARPPDTTASPYEGALKREAGEADSHGRGRQVRQGTTSHTKRLTTSQACPRTCQASIALATTHTIPLPLHVSPPDDESEHLGDHTWRWQGKRAKVAQAEPSRGKAGVIRDHRCTVFLRNLPYAVRGGGGRGSVGSY